MASFFVLNWLNYFREYRNDSFKPVLQEHIDSAHFLNGNTNYPDKIIVLNGLIMHLFNYELFWEMVDTKAYTDGF